jgi:hypothetical protein
VWDGRLQTFFDRPHLNKWIWLGSSSSGSARHASQRKRGEKHEDISITATKCQVKEDPLIERRLLESFYDILWPYHEHWTLTILFFCECVFNVCMNVLFYILLQLF